METIRAQDTAEIDLGDVASRLMVRWRILLFTFIIGALAAFCVSSLLPKKYESCATIYAQQNSLSSSLLRDLPTGLISSGGGSSGYLGVLLRSDTMLRRVIYTLNLTKNRNFCQSKQIDIDKVIKRLKESVTVAENKNGSIDIVVRASNPKLAAKIANAILDNLGMLVSTGSERKTDFISEKLIEVNRKLHLAEDDLLRFQKKNDVASIDEETQSMITQLSELDAKSVASEMELREVNSELANSGELDTLVGLEVRKKSVESSKQYLDKRIAELQEKMSDVPAVAIQYARLQRKLSTLNKTYELLTEQYQLASISQHGEDGDYTVIDRARPVKEPVSPRRMLNTAIGGMIGLFIGAFAAVRANKSPYPRRKYSTRARSAVH